MASVRRWSRAAVAACLTASLGVGVVVALVLAPPPARALATSCQIFVDGTDVSQAATPATAIRVPPDAALRVNGTANAPIENVQLAIMFGPIPVFSWSEPVPPVREWSETFPVGQYTSLGAGFYQVTGRIDECAVSAWVLLESPSPLTTVASLVALAVLVAGAITVTVGLAAAVRSRGGLVRSVVGGAVVGASALVLAQQSGVVPADTTSMVSWTVLPGGAAGVAHTLVGSVVTRRARQRESGTDAGYPYQGDYGQSADYQPGPGYGSDYEYPSPSGAGHDTGGGYGTATGYGDAPTTASVPEYGGRGYETPPYSPPPPPSVPPPSVPPPPYGWQQPTAAPPAADRPRSRGFGLPASRAEVPFEPTAPSGWEEPTAAARDFEAAPPVGAAPPDEAAVGAAPPDEAAVGADPSHEAAVGAAPPDEAAVGAEPEPAGEAPPEVTPTPAGATPPGEAAAEEETAAAVPAAVERDPPRESYAHIDSPETVVAEEEFELVVGLASVPDREVVGGPLVRPERSIGSYTMTIQVIADGFRLTRPHESWRVDLRVTAAAPYPTAILHLAAQAQPRPVVAQTIRAMFSVDGQAIGLAARPIAVVRDASLLAASGPPPAVEPTDISLPTDEKPADLTVRIELSQPAGRLLVQLLAADPLVQLPTDPLVVDIGGEPDAFLRDIIGKMNAAEGQPGMYQKLMGIGLTIADQLPLEFWEVVAAVATRVGDRPPTILFLSAEPYVPWELAVMEQPLDSSLPPFLAAQAAVGRWVLGQRRPKLPPPAEVLVRSIAVVAGEYVRPGWERLVEAEAEADELSAAYGAVKVNASSQAVLRLVGGDPQAELLHFAVHGQYDPNGEIDGIVLVDGLTLDPMWVRGSPLRSRPFVFLNACQVGSGHAVLGDYAGLAQAFLFAGASGVIAPLWSIDDVMAREIALRFYEKALGGRAPADILREERAAFRDDPATISSTYLAYQFFGHPHMTIARAAD